MTVWQKRALMALVSAVCGAALGSGYYLTVYAVEQLRPPIVAHIGASVATPDVVPPGASFHVTLSYRKVQDCPGAWAYFVRWSGQDGWELLRSGAAGANPTGVYEFRHQITLPIDAPPGLAEWREVLTMTCAGQQTVSRSTPVPFTVTAP